MLTSKTILITGMNKNQTTRDYFKRQQLKVVPCQYALIRCLEDMGWTVSQDVFSLNWSTITDETIVYLAKPQQLIASNIYDGLNAIACTPDCILGFDDWQIDDILQSLEKCQGNENLYTDFILKNHNRTRESITDFERDLHQKALAIIASRKNRILVPAFAGGDLSKIINWPAELIFSFNPNPYHLNRVPDFGIEGPPEKRRSFNFASLVQSKTKKWINAQKTSWPIHYYGSKADSQDRKTEDQMVNIFAEDWGCLMPGYYHAGSGWWRARPLQVAMAGSILIGDREELKVLYGEVPELDVMTKASNIEAFSDQELEEFAKMQHDYLMAKHPLNKEVTKAELEKCLRH